MARKSFKQLNREVNQQPQPKLTPAQERERAVAHLQRALDRIMLDGKEHAEKLSARLVANKYVSWGAMDALEWTESYSTEIAMGAFAESVYAAIDRAKENGTKMALEAAAAKVIEEERGNLLRNSYRGSSTSAFHNAAQGARREGAVRFIERIGQYLDDIKSVDAIWPASRTEGGNG